MKKLNQVQYLRLKKAFNKNINNLDPSFLESSEELHHYVWNLAEITGQDDPWGYWGAYEKVLDHNLCDYGTGLMLFWESWLNDGEKEVNENLYISNCHPHHIYKKSYKMLKSNSFICHNIKFNPETIYKNKTIFKIMPTEQFLLKESDGIELDLNSYKTMKEIDIGND